MVELKAPKGKFRVVKVDTFDRDDWVDGDYETLKTAKQNAVGGEMLKAYVFDDDGCQLYSSGTF